LDRRDAWDEIERGAREIFEAFMHLVMQFIDEMRRRNQSLEERILAQIHHTFRTEMEKNISEQLRKQMSNLRISTIEWKDRSGGTMKVHLTDDHKDGKEYAFRELKGDKLLFQPTDQKGGSIQLDIREIEKALPALEGRIQAMGTLSKMDEKQVTKSLLDSFERAKQKNLSLTEAYKEVMGEQFKKDIHEMRRHDLDRAKHCNDYFQKRKDHIQLELNKINIEKLELKTELDVGSITKKEFKKRNKDLDKMDKKLKGEMKELNRMIKRTDKLLEKEIWRHTGFVTKKLDFEDKIELAERVFQAPEEMDKGVWREQFERNGDEKGLQLLDQIEGRNQEMELEIEREETTLSMPSSFE